jgi:hypothetical protein
MIAVLACRAMPLNPCALCGSNAERRLEQRFGIPTSPE